MITGQVGPEFQGSLVPVRQHHEDIFEARSQRPNVGHRDILLGQVGPQRGRIEPAFPEAVDRFPKDGGAANRGKGGRPLLSAHDPDWSKLLEWSEAIFVR